MSQIAAARGEDFAVVATDTRWSRGDEEGYDGGGKVAYVPGVGFLASSGGNGGSALTSVSTARARFFAGSTPESVVDLLRGTHETYLPACEARGWDGHPWMYGLAALGDEGAELWTGAGPEWGMSEDGIGSTFTPPPPACDDGHVSDWNEAVRQLGARHATVPMALQALGRLFHAGRRRSPRVSDRLHAGVADCTGEEPVLRFLDAEAERIARAPEEEVLELTETLIPQRTDPDPVAAGATSDPAVVELFQVVDYTFNACGSGGLDVTVEWKISNFDSGKFTITLEFWGDWDSDGVYDMKDSETAGSQIADTTASTDHYTYSVTQLSEDGTCSAEDAYVKIIVTRDATGEATDAVSSSTIRASFFSCLDSACVSGE